MESPDTLVDIAGLVLDVDGERWAYHVRVYLMLNKPAGVECPQKSKHHPSVYTLLPVSPRERAAQCVGWLDQDATRLLLLTDDGQFVHTTISPYHQVPKVYKITTAEPMTEAQIVQLCAGVLLADGNKNVAAAWAERVDTHHLRTALTQGKYHRVKRTVAAADNHVADLHRSAIGGLPLGNLAPGEWCWLGAADLEALSTAPPHTTKPSA